MHELHLSPRFNGPPDSANGGYTCGRLASVLGSPCVQVTLRLPPPLGTPMQVELRDDKLQLKDDDRLVAEAVSAELSLEIPEPPSLAEAERATERYIGHRHHPFPTCFVCGPQHPNGLGIFAGPLGERVAALWTPTTSLADESGMVRSEYIWCALDCPGAFSVDQNMENPRVLGRLVGRLDRPLPAGQPAIVVGWPLGFERRKAFAGTAVFDSDGQLCAAAKATWIAISPR